MPELEDEEDSDHENWPQLETKKTVQYVAYLWVKEMC